MDTPVNGAVKDDIELGVRCLKSDSKMHKGEQKLAGQFETSEVPSKYVPSDYMPDYLKPLSMEELNAATLSPSAFGESNEPGSYTSLNGWTIFRMLIPKDVDGMVIYNNASMEKLLEQLEAEIVIYDVAGVRVVMVSAKNNSRRSTSPAVDAFLRVHEYFLDRMGIFPPSSESRLIRLLVPAAHAKDLIVSSKFKSIWEKTRCPLAVYLTDNVPVLSRGDVIIEVGGVRERVQKAIELMAYELGKYTVNESLISELKAGNGIQQPNSEIVAYEEELTSKFASLKAQRIVQATHHIGIPLNYVGYIIGEDDENIETIRQSSPASVIIEPGRPDEVHIMVAAHNDSQAREATNVMERFIPKEHGEPPVFKFVEGSWFAITSPPIGKLYY